MKDAQQSPTVIEKRLARTYNHPSYDDSYDAVRDYRRVQRTAARNPNKGSQALSTLVELPRGRIRGWVDGENTGMPDAVRAITVAQNKGWLNPTGDTAVALASLMGHLLGGGSIAKQNYTPSVCEGRRVSTKTIEPAFRRLGISTTTRHTDATDRATEIVPTQYSSILGRTMVAYGCPAGGRNDIVSVPKLLDQMDTTGHTAFLEAYVLHRGVNYRQKATSRLQGEQPLEFHRAIAGLIESATGESTRADKRGVTVSAAAMRALNLDE